MSLKLGTTEITPYIKVNLNEGPLDAVLSITPSTLEQTFVAKNDGLIGYGTVNVSRVDASIDGNIIPENIKSGVSILGVTGTLEENTIVAPEFVEMTITPDRITQTIEQNNFRVNIIGDNDLVASNILNGVEIFGVRGTLQPYSEPEARSITVTPSTRNQVFTQNNFTVNVIGDSDLVAENIKSGVELFGITGTLEPSTSSEASLEPLYVGELTNLITPSEGKDGFSSVYIDDIKYRLMEHNYNTMRNSNTPSEMASIIDISEGSYGSFALHNCTYMNKVFMRECTSLQNNVFDNCIDLEELTIPKVTELLNSTFEACYRFIDVRLPKVCNLDTYSFKSTFNHPNNTKGTLELGGLVSVRNDAFIYSGNTLNTILIGDALVGRYHRNYTGFLQRDTDSPHQDRYGLAEADFATLPDNAFGPAKIESLIIPEVSGVYGLAGALSSGNLSNLSIYVDDTLVNTYKTNWSTYSSKIKPLTDHYLYNYDFEYDELKFNYKATSWNSYSLATQANNMSLVTPRGYKEHGVSLGQRLFNGCYFDKLTIGRNTFGLDTPFTGATINTLEFEDFRTLHEVSHYTFNLYGLENVILNGTVEEWFDWYQNDNMGFVYYDSSKTEFTTLSRRSAPWAAQHVYMFPGFEITDLYIPPKPFETNYTLGTGALYNAHFDNIYLNTNIKTIGAWAFENAHDTNIYIPKSVNNIRAQAFIGLSNAHIYFEAEEAPSGFAAGWNDNFDLDNVTVHWGHKM